MLLPVCSTPLTPTVIKYKEYKYDNGFSDTWGFGPSGGGDGGGGHGSHGGGHGSHGGHGSDHGQDEHGGHGGDHHGGGGGGSDHHGGGHNSAHGGSGGSSWGGSGNGGSSGVYRGPTNYLSHLFERGSTSTPSSAVTDDDSKDKTEAPASSSTK